MLLDHCVSYKTYESFALFKGANPKMPQKCVDGLSPPADKPIFGMGHYCPNIDFCPSWIQAIELGMDDRYPTPEEVSLRAETAAQEFAEYKDRTALGFFQRQAIRPPPPEAYIDFRERAKNLEDGSEDKGERVAAIEQQGGNVSNAIRQGKGEISSAIQQEKPGISSGFEQKKDNVRSVLDKEDIYGTSGHEKDDTQSIIDDEDLYGVSDDEYSKGSNAAEDDESSDYSPEDLALSSVGDSTGSSHLDLLSETNSETDPEAMFFIPQPQSHPEPSQLASQTPRERRVYSMDDVEYRNNQTTDSTIPHHENQRQPSPQIEVEYPRFLSSMWSLFSYFAGLQDMDLME